MARLIRNKQGTPCTLLTHFLNSPTSLLNHPYYNTSNRYLQTLAFEEIQANPNKPYTHTAFILHGLLGSARNWRSFSRSLASSLSSSPSSEWRMVLVDLRNRGKSAEIEGFDPPHDMVNETKDLGNLINSKNRGSPDVVIGHSMGGKVALQFAQSCGNIDYGENVKLPK
ncbi:protein phosphatase methylesterase 1-like [Hibiscus syriacus]|uniref:protein phosphatase methylesterase 1-like n=1 Tax=Hibiscus syriacus TaxID=106335 RepID=UPI001920F46F|nr:protein phosphatase methylesterase 1-like [Hibiscus syriacus]